MALLPTRIITIGDPHIGEASDGTANLTLVANYLKNQSSEFDLIVVLGDYHDLVGTENILGIVGKPIRFVKGNHDSLVGCDSLGSLFGDSVEIFNGYQLIFVGACGSNPGGPIMIKAYNYSLPTIVFDHYPSACLTEWSDYYKTGCGYVNTLGLTKLLGVYSGHVHKYSNQIIGDTLYVTEDNLGGNGPAGDYIGYTCIVGNDVTYSRLNYRTGTIIPDCIETVICNNPICNLVISQ